MKKTFYVLGLSILLLFPMLTTSVSADTTTTGSAGITFTGTLNPPKTHGNGNNNSQTPQSPKTSQNPVYRVGKLQKLDTRVPKNQITKNPGDVQTGVMNPANLKSGIVLAVMSAMVAAFVGLFELARKNKSAK